MGKLICGFLPAQEIEGSKKSMTINKIILKIDFVRKKTELRLTADKQTLKRFLSKYRATLERNKNG